MSMHTTPKRLLALPHGSLRRRVASGVFWSLVGAALLQGATLVVSVGLARILGIERFGEWSLVYSTVAMLGVFAGLGLGLTATKHIAQHRRTDPDRVGRIMGLLEAVVLASSALAAVLLALVAPLMAEHLLDAPHLADALRLGTLALLLNTAIGLQTGELAGFEAFRPAAAINLIRAAIGIPLILLAAAAAGVLGAIAAFSATLAIHWAANRLVIARVAAASGVRRTLNGGRQELPILWRYALPALLASVMVTPAAWVANAILVNAPNGYVELGGLAAANQWRFVVAFVPTVASVAIMPILAGLLGEGRRSSSARVLSAGLLGSVTVALPISAILVVAAEPIMALSGAAFARYADTLAVIGGVTFVTAALAPIGQLIAASGRMWLGAAMNFVWAALFIGLAAVLVALGHGALGVAWAYLVSYAVNAVWAIAVALRVTRG